jgi:hypothetical protein
VVSTPAAHNGVEGDLLSDGTPPGLCPDCGELLVYAPAEPAEPGNSVPFSSPAAMECECGYSELCEDREEAAREVRRTNRAEEMRERQLDREGRL